MFKYSNDPGNAIITVSLLNVEHSPKTSMYYPHGEVPVINDGYFTIGSFKYVPTIVNTRVGRKIDIVKE